MSGLRQGYTCVYREGVCYLNTELAMAGFQTDSYAEQLDPAQACLRLLLSSLPQAKMVVVVGVCPFKPTPPGPGSS